MKQNKKTKESVLNGLEKTGTVKSVKMQKTVVVAVIHTVRHPLYKKSVRRTKRYAAHNENLELRVGDKVTIVETKPFSKTKHFLVMKKIA